MIFFVFSIEISIKRNLKFTLLALHLLEKGKSCLPAESAPNHFNSGHTSEGGQWLKEAGGTLFLHTLFFIRTLSTQVSFLKFLNFSLF